MELEELQKVWNEQKGENMYTINEESLRKIITRKKDAATRHVNRTEIGLIIITLTLGTIIVTKALIKNEGWWEIGGGMAIFLMTIFISVFRAKRKKAENRFDRSMIGEIDHALANTNSVMQISTWMIFWYMIPIAVFTYGQMIFAGVSWDKFFLITGMFILAFFLIHWERKRCHIPRKEKLQKLKAKLLE